MAFQQILQKLRARCFLLTGGEYFAVSKVSAHTPHSIPEYALVIVGREHYLEETLRLPITDPKDLSQVLKQRQDDFDLHDAPRINENGAEVRTVKLKPSIKHQLAELRWCFWLPESWLLRGIKNGMTVYQRASQSIYVANNAGHTYSSPAVGQLASPAMFLMSIGMDSGTEHHRVADCEYEQSIINGLKGLTASQWLQLLKAQYTLAAVKTLCHWPSVTAGLILGYLAFSVGDLALTNWRLGQLDAAIAQQNVAELVGLQRQVEAQQQQLSALQSASSDVPASALAWDLITQIINRDTNLLLINIEGARVELRFEAKKATDVLQRIQDSPLVASATFSTAVRESLGNERFTVAVEWN